MGINSSLLKSVQTIVDRAISISSFDKTRQAIVLSNNNNGTYSIILDGVTYPNIPTYPHNSLINAGDTVKIKIPTNNTNKMYIMSSNNCSLLGEIKIYAGLTAPNGWLICDGSEQLISKYSGLYAIIGNTYGSASDNAHFKLPDLRGRVPIGVSGGHTLASSGGEETHVLTPRETATKNHSHTINHKHGFTQPKIPDHKHGIPGKWSTGSGSTTAYTTSANRTGVARNTSTDGGGGSCTGGDVNQYNGSSGGQTEANGSAHNNMQPFLTLNYIIYVGVPTL